MIQRIKQFRRQVASARKRAYKLSYRNDTAYGAQKLLSGGNASQESYRFGRGRATDFRTVRRFGFVTGYEALLSDGQWFNVLDISIINLSTGLRSDYGQFLYGRGHNVVSLDIEDVMSYAEIDLRGQLITAKEALTYAHDKNDYANIACWAEEAAQHAHDLNAIPHVIQEIKSLADELEKEFSYDQGAGVFTHASTDMLQVLAPYASLLHPWQRAAVKIVQVRALDRERPADSPSRAVNLAYEITASPVQSEGRYQDVQTAVIAREEATQRAAGIGPWDRPGKYDR